MGKSEANLVEWHSKKDFSIIYPILLLGKCCGCLVGTFKKEKFQITTPSKLNLIAVLCVWIIFFFFTVYETFEVFEMVSEGKIKNTIVIISFLSMLFGNFFATISIPYFLFRRREISFLFTLWKKVTLTFHPRCVLWERMQYLKHHVGKKMVIILYGLYMFLAVQGVVITVYVFWYYPHNPMAMMSHYSFLDGTTMLYQVSSILEIIGFSLRQIALIEIYALVEITIAVLSLNISMYFRHMNMALVLEIEEVENTCIYPSETDTSETNSKNICSRDQLHNIFMTAVDSHALLSDFTHRLNTIFGPLILLDCSISFVMITASIYGVINSFCLDSMSMELDFVLSAGNFLMRLLILIPTYAYVRKSSDEVGIILSRAATWVPRATLIRLTFYLQRLRCVPTAVSAWGFFSITFYSLLMFWSLVVTYQVLLIQG